MTGDSRTVRVILAGALLAHFVVLCVVKLQHGHAPQILWLSNVTLLLTAVGVFTRSRLVLATALVNVLIPHVLWIADYCVGQTYGRSPLGLTTYLDSESRWLQVTSVHHFYLVPLLLASFRRPNLWPRESWLFAATGFVLLSLVCRGLLPVADNVNFAYFVPSRLSRWPIKVLTNWPEPLYLMGIHAAMNLLAFGPADCLLRRLYGVGHSNFKIGDSAVCGSNS